MQLIWSHGKDAAPWGFKSLALAEVAKARGLEMQAPDYQEVANPDERVVQLVERLSEGSEPLALAGSSMGAYVSLAAALDPQVELRVKGLFLLAPALYMPGYHWQDFPSLSVPRVELVHGWRDEIVPVENSLRFAAIHRSRLHVIDAEHRLRDATDLVSLLFDAFLADLLVPDQSSGQR